MRTLIAVRPGLAREMRRRLVHGTYRIVDTATDTVELRRLIHEDQSSLVVLDVGFGGREYSVLDCVGKIVENVRTQPPVIAVAESPTDDVRRRAAEAGCQAVIDLIRPSWPSDLARALAVALVASKAKAKVEESRDLE
jgi:CheY-like chemotaxis protein